MVIAVGVQLQPAEENNVPSKMVTNGGRLLPSLLSLQKSTGFMVVLVMALCHFKMYLHKHLAGISIQLFMT